MNENERLHMLTSCIKYKVARAQGGLRGGFGHIAVNAPDVYAFSAALEKVCERTALEGSLS